MKIYNKDEFANLTRDQKTVIAQHKINNGWIDNVTPPNGFIIDQSTGLPVPIHTQRTINTVGSLTQPPLPPPTVPIRPAGSPPPNVPTSIEVSAGSAGSAFGRAGGSPPNDDQTSVISRVTINGRAYSGPLYDANGNRIN